MSEYGKLSCFFSGFNLKHGVGTKSVSEMGQLAYVSSVKPLPIDASFSNFISICMKLACLGPTRPDGLFEVLQLAQVTDSVFEANP